ncbi:putative transcription factor IIS, TFIIS/LEDGF domain superfamily [Plasmopara halstedii]
MGSSDDERKKRSINEMFGDEDSDDSGDEQLPRQIAATTTADASGLFGSDSESEDEEKQAKHPVSPPSKRVKKEEIHAPEGDEYDSGDDVVATKDDDDFIDGDDDLADVLGEYNQEHQQFDDERPTSELQPLQEQKDDFFENTLKNLKTGRARSKLNLSPQEMEQITQEVLYRMDKAYADDLVSIAERRPALEKIKFVDNALHILRKVQFQPMLLDFDLLTIVKKWIQPFEDGTLPNVGLRTKILDMVSKMPVFKEHLKRSGLGKVVMVLMKHPQETIENKELCRSLVERWSRAVFNKTLDFSKLAELEAEKAENEIYRRRERARRQKKSKTKMRAADRGGNVFNGRSAELDVKFDVSERAELPEQLHIDFLLRPQSKVDMSAAQAKKVDPDSRKARLVKRMQEIARPGRKTKRATGVSVEGR